MEKIKIVSLTIMFTLLTILTITIIKENITYSNTNFKEKIQDFQNRLKECAF